MTTKDAEAKIRVHQSWITEFRKQRADLLEKLKVVNEQIEENTRELAKLKILVEFGELEDPFSKTEIHKVRVDEVRHLFGGSPSETRRWLKALGFKSQIVRRGEEIVRAWVRWRVEY